MLHALVKIYRVCLQLTNFMRLAALPCVLKNYGDSINYLLIRGWSLDSSFYDHLGCVLDGNAL